VRDGRIDAVRFVATIILLTSSGLLFLVAVISFWQRRWLANHGTRTKGVVSDMPADDSSGYTAVVSFTLEGDAVTADDRVVSFRVKTNEPLESGSEVDVLYNPNNSRNAAVASARQLWASPIRLSVWGLLACGAAVVSHFAP